MKYRADIDGLRAVAVIPVLLFHAGFALFSGGYVGVDVFFVISGFLITRIISREIKEDRFSVVRFYERRIRRIFPALIAVVLFSWAAACVLLLPPEFLDFSKSVAATALFVSNMYFWSGSGYFAGDANGKPLLHVWSLSVEEQFYILFPLLLLFLPGRAGGSRQLRFLVALGAVSFAANQYLVTTDPTAAFYYSPGRAWELLAGSLLALGAVPVPKSPIVRQGLAAAGLGLIAWSVVAFAPDTPFPGVSALAPCLGAAMIILAGDGQETFVGRLLGLAPLVFVGQISYSLYLWHWPLLVFAQHASLSPLSRGATAAVLLASLIAATLSWRLVERPFRGSGAWLDRRQLFTLAGIALVCGAALGLFGRVTGGWPSRFEPETVRLAAFEGVELPGRDSCTVDDPCRAGLAQSSNEIVLWGDSHAQAIAPMLDRVAKRYGFALTMYWQRACLPVIRVVRNTEPLDCAAFNEDVLNHLLAQDKGRPVVLLGRWSYVVEGEVRDGISRNRFSDASGRRLNKEEQEQLLARQLNGEIEKLSAHGDSVVVVYPIPEFRDDVPLELAKRFTKGLEPASYNLPLSAYQTRQAFISGLFDGQAGLGRITAIRPEEALCQAGRCLAYADGVPLYIDSHHLSATGADRLEPLFDSALRKLSGGR